MARIKGFLHFPDFRIQKFSALCSSASPLVVATLNWQYCQMESVAPFARQYREMLHVLTEERPMRYIENSKQGFFRRMRILESA